VIITTHYIEEARSAAQVAFMNSGTILKQSAPNQLMSEYQCSTLEEVFLRLCQRDIQRRKSRQMSLVQALSTVRIDEILEDVEESPKNGHKLNKKLIEVSRIKAMLWKYYVLALRRPMFLIMYYMIPIVALVTMNWTISQSPYNIPVAIYNADLNPKLSQLYIDSIDKEYLRLTEYPDNASAFESVVKGKNYLSINFAENFSDSFETRLTDVFDLSDLEVNDSLIKIYIDFSGTVQG